MACLIYVACFTYNDNAVKVNERKWRGFNNKFVICSIDLIVPSEFQRFQNNGDNKEHLFEIVEEIWTEKMYMLINCIRSFSELTSVLGTSEQVLLLLMNFLQIIRRLIRN